MIEIAVSILCADFTQLGAQLREAFTAGVSRIHVDVMDGQFVPNLSMGPEVTENRRALREAASRSAPVYEPTGTGRMPS